MEAAIWFAIGGALLVTMTLGSSWLERLPVSSAMFYLLVGVILGPGWIALSRLEPLSSSHFLERLAEVVVVISLFTCGLKLGGSLRDRRWIAPLRLAVVSMLLTVGLNDGTAFPVVMLGLGLLGLHEIGQAGWRWLAVDLVWAVAAASRSVPCSAPPSGTSSCTFGAFIGTRSATRTSSRSA